MFWKVIESIQIVYVLLIYVIHPFNHPHNHIFFHPSSIYSTIPPFNLPSIHSHATTRQPFIHSSHPSIHPFPRHPATHPPIKPTIHPSIHPSIHPHELTQPVIWGHNCLQTTQRMSRFCFRKHLLLFVSVAKPPPRDHMVLRGLDGTAQRNSVHWCQCGWLFLRHRFDPQTLAGASVHSHCFDDPSRSVKIIFVQANFEKVTSLGYKLA